MANMNQVPQIVHRKDIIQLGADISCKCGRTKERAHCPSCGRIKLYAMADNVIAIAPDNIAVRECKTYRCLGCGEKFNDVDWYFNCHAPIKIDWAATKKAQKEQRQKEATEKWLLRIEMGERFSYNDRTQCKAETGFDPEVLRELNRALEIRKKQLTPEQKDKIEQTADKLRQQRAGLPVIDSNKKLTPLQQHIENCNHCMTNDELCPVGQKLQNGDVTP